MKLKPGRRYTRVQLRELIDQAEASELQLQGYVLRHDVLDDMYSIVPWYEAGGAKDFGPHSNTITQTGLRKPRMGQGAFAAPDPIRKRTANERVDSLMKRMLEDCLRSGTVPGLGDERISLILGYTKDTDREGITAEEIRRIAASFLAKAEAEKNAADTKKVTTPSQNDWKG